MTELVKKTFDFNNSTVRVVGTSNKPIFFAKDICNILEIKNVSHALVNIPEKWKGIVKSDTSYTGQEMLTLTEPGLYRLIMRSNKPVAQKFQEWVCEDVLPSIRKTGEYKFQKKLDDKEKEISHLNSLLKRKLRKTNPKGNCVYLVKSPDIDGKYKIGCTKDIDRRLQDYGDASPHEYELLLQRPMKCMKSVETLLLYILDSKRCESDYKGSKKREWVKLDSEIVMDEINGLCDYISERREHYTPEQPLDIPVPPEEVTHKKCSSCDETKGLGLFYDRPDNVDQKEGVCKECYAKRQKEAKENKRVSLLADKTKKCRRCKKVNPLSMYKELVTSKDGYSYICSNCNVKPVVHKTEKNCSMCKEKKKVEEFNKCRTSVDGHFSYCRPCTKIKNKLYKDKTRKKS